MNIRFLPACTALLLSATFLASPLRAADPLIANGDFANGMEGWSLSKLEHTDAEINLETVENGKHAAHIKVPKAGDKRYYVQLIRKGVKLEEGKTYHLHFRARSTPAGEVVVIAAAYHGKFDEMFRQDHLAITDTWADYSCDIKPKFGDQDAQVIFSGLAAQAGEFWFTDVTLQEAN